MATLATTVWRSLHAHDVGGVASGYEIGRQVRQRAVADAAASDAAVVRVLDQMVLVPPEPAVDAAGGEVWLQPLLERSAALAVGREQVMVREQDGSCATCELSFQLRHLRRRKRAVHIAGIQANQPPRIVA